MGGLHQELQCLCSAPRTKKTNTPLSFDGIEGDYYTLSVPRLVARFEEARRLPPQARLSPHDPIRRVLAGRPAPAEIFDRWNTPSPATRSISDQPVLFHVDAKKQIIIDNALFPNPYAHDRRPCVWWKDSRAFTFEYNQRGHQVYRVIEVDAATGKPRALITEECKTFFCYSGKKYRYDLPGRQGDHLDVGAGRLEPSLSL